MINLFSASCTRCCHCVKVCPSNIFTISDDRSVQIKNESSCIHCGHCVAVCPSGAILHDLFPMEKIHAIDRSTCATPEQMLSLIRKRRSNRAFSKQSIPEEFLVQILEAAHRAPTASNSQNVEFMLITDIEKIKLVIEFTLDSFASILKLVDNFVMRPIVKRFLPDVYKYIPMFKRQRRIYYEQNKDGILRHAKAILFIYAPQTSRFGCEDCNLAYQNASLMAESLGVSQFYTGFVMIASKRRSQKLEKILGIHGKIYAGMALGMPLFEYPNYVDRKDIVVKY